jgi:hypothetical protein
MLNDNIKKELAEAKQRLFSVKFKKYDDCCICIASKSEVKFDGCRHTCVCVNCFMKCLEEQNHNLRRCPLCRIPFDYTKCRKV